MSPVGYLPLKIVSEPLQVVDVDRPGRETFPIVRLFVPLSECPGSDSAGPDQPFDSPVDPSLLLLAVIRSGRRRREYSSSSGSITFFPYRY